MEPVLGKTASARIALRCNVSIMVMQVEEVFGWMKTVGMLRKTRHRGVFKVGWVFTFAATAYNLVRMRDLPSAVQSARARGQPLARHSFVDGGGFRITEPRPIGTLPQPAPAVHLPPHASRRQPAAVRRSRRGRAAWLPSARGSNATHGTRDVPGDAHDHLVAGARLGEFVTSVCRL